MNCFSKPGCPAGVVNIVPGLGETAGDAISRHSGIDKIAFTGSTEVGRKILHSATANLKKVSLELGGKSPMFVFADADLEQAVPGTAQAIFNNAGQVCIAGSRLYAEKAIYERVLQGIADFADNIRVGPRYVTRYGYGTLDLCQATGPRQPLHRQRMQ